MTGVRNLTRPLEMTDTFLSFPFLAGGGIRCRFDQPWWWLWASGLCQWSNWRVLDKYLAHIIYTIRYDIIKAQYYCVVRSSLKLVFSSLIAWYAFRDGSGSSDANHLVHVLELLTNLPCTLYYHGMIIKRNVNACISLCKDFVTVSRSRVSK